MIIQKVQIENPLIRFFDELSFGTQCHNVTMSKLHNGKSSININNAWKITKKLLNV